MFYGNSVWPSDAIWQHKPGSTLAEVMAYCMTAPKPLSDPKLTFDFVRFCGIYMGAMTQRVPNILVCIMSFKVTYSDLS